MRVLILLFAAAFLEVGGDALVRAGVKEGRLWAYPIGALVLLIYSVAVNKPAWDFGRLLGVYIAVFFLVSQLLAYLVYHEPIRLPTILGGLLIVTGGLMITLWQPK
jgi:small multidrug resistance family-3 protein